MTNRFTFVTVQPSREQIVADTKAAIVNGAASSRDVQSIERALNAGRTVPHDALHRIRNGASNK
jgi:hypothetical protein